MERSELITTRSEGSVRIITLARSHKRNALTPLMVQELLDAIARATSDESAHALMLTGEGETFCAGFDLTLCKDDDQALRQLLTGLSACIRALRHGLVPVVISAHGAAIAGGCALLGGADYVVTTHSAKIGYPVLKLGISPAVSAPTLLHSASAGAARTRLLDTALVSGDDAARLGIAHALTRTAQACQDASLDWARSIASKPAHALRATRRWLTEIDGTGDPAIFQRALAASLGLVGGDEERAMLPAAWTPR